MSHKAQKVIAFLIGDLLGAAVVLLIGAFLFSGSDGKPDPKPTTTVTTTATPSATPSTKPPTTSKPPQASPSEPATPKPSSLVATHTPQAKTHTAHAPANTSRSENRYATGSPRAYAQSVLGPAQFSCLDAVVRRESGWNIHATNPSSGAYGIPQALPGSKMASAGADWRTNGVTQVKWMIMYVNSRYGSVCGAWSFWQGHNYY